MGFWSLLVLSQILNASVAESVSIHSICTATERQKKGIESCLKDVQSSDCEGIPKEQLRDCFDPAQEYIDSANSEYTCMKGTIEGIRDTAKGAAEIASRVYQSVSDKKSYQERVRRETFEACEKDKEILQARQRYREIAQNIGADLAAQKYGAELNNQYMQCARREQKRGENYGIHFELPKSDDVKPIFLCLNSNARTEVSCKIVGPMIVGGATALPLKSLIKSGMKRLGLGSSAKVEKAYQEYLQSVKGKLSPKEIESLKHQNDLLTAINNPAVAARIEATGVDLEALTKGIIDSDFGKLEAGQKLLMESSIESDRLLNILKGTDQSRAGAAYRKHMQEIGHGGKVDLPKYTNEEIRKIFKEKPILAGQLHELPGMSRAFHDFDTGKINERQLIDRLNANRGHNHSPERSHSTIGRSGEEIIPFWDDLESKFVPGQLAGDAKRAQFFSGTVYDSGKVSASGVTIPRYPTPSQKSVFIHSVFDRLSQGTGGGNVKIFYETAGKAVSDNPHISIGEIADLTNFGQKNGLNNLANQLTGTVIRKADGSYVQTFSNAERTHVQFRGLLQAIEKSKATAAEKTALSDLTRAARDRNLAYDDFVKNQIDYVKDSNGNILKMTLKDADGKYLGTISKETPTSEAMKFLEKFNKIEEKINGDPFRDLMSPRMLSSAEARAYNLPASGAYYYCSKSKVSPSYKPPTTLFPSGSQMELEGMGTH